MDIERLQSVTSQFWDFCQLLRASRKSDENLGFGIEELGKLPTEFNWVWIPKIIIFSLMRETRTNWLRVVAAGSHWEKLIRCWSALTMGDDTYIVGMYALSYVCVDHNKNDTYLVLVNVLSRVDCNQQWCTCSMPWLGKGKGYEGEILMLAYEHKSLYILVTHRWRRGWGFPTLYIQSIAKGTTGLKHSWY